MTLWKYHAAYFSGFVFLSREPESVFSTGPQGRFGDKLTIWLILVELEIEVPN